MPHQNKHLNVNTHKRKILHIKFRLSCFLPLAHTPTVLKSQESMPFLCAHLSFMWFYDDILIKVISLGVGTVIKNIL